MKCGACLWIGRIALAIALPIVLPLSFLETTIFTTGKIGLFFVNGWAGCWPWTPKRVEYYPGMTLCPGQTAYTTLTVPLPVPPDQILGVEVVSSSPDIQVTAEFVPPKDRMN